MPCYDTYCSRPATKVTATDKKVRVEIHFVPKRWIHAERSYQIMYLIRYKVCLLSLVLWCLSRKVANSSMIRCLEEYHVQHTRLFWARLEL